MSDSDREAKPRRLWSGKLWIVLGVVALLAISFLLLCVEQREPTFLHDPSLIKTTPPSPMIMAPTTLYQKLWWKYYEWKRKRFPNPMSYSFNASPATRCSIHGLLNQCMEAGGMQYCIEQSVAGGTVMFGNTNVLNGRQWIEAFEAALQTNTPEWWDSKMNGFRHENLVLLRYGNRITLVLSRKTAQEYQQLYPALKGSAAHE